MWILTDFVSALPLPLVAACPEMGRIYADNLTAIARAAGLGTGVASLWRHGKRRPSNLARFVFRLVEMHGLDALLSGELAQTPNKVAQDSTQPVATKKRRAKRTK